MSRYIYLASPYSHERAYVRIARYHAACRAAAALMDRGIVIEPHGAIHAVYSPIAHGHPIDPHLPGTRSHAWWMAQCLPLLRHASVLAVLELPGWNRSVGVRMEMDMAAEWQIPVRSVVAT